MVKIELCHQWRPPVANSKGELGQLDGACSNVDDLMMPVRQLVCLFVCLYVVIKPDNPYFASYLGLEVNPPGVFPLGPYSSSCGPTKATPPPRTTLRANWGEHSTSWRVGSHPWTYTSPGPHICILVHWIASLDLPRLIPPNINTQGSLVP